MHHDLFEKFNHRTAILPMPLSWLSIEAAISASPPSLLVEVSLMDHDLLEDFDRHASILPMPLSWLPIEATITACPHSPLVEVFLTQSYLLLLSHNIRTTCTPFRTS